VKKPTMKQVRIVLQGLARRDRKRPLNDGQIPNPNVLRVAPCMGNNREEGNRRASRNGRVGHLPPETPKRHDSQLLRHCTLLSPPLLRPGRCGPGRRSAGAGAGEVRGLWRAAVQEKRVREARELTPPL
jgi:hypothetical protein